MIGPNHTHSRRTIGAHTQRSHDRSTHTEDARSVHTHSSRTIGPHTQKSHDRSTHTEAARSVDTHRGRTLGRSSHTHTADARSVHTHRGRTIGPLGPDAQGWHTSTTTTHTPLYHTSIGGSLRPRAGTPRVLLRQVDRVQCGIATCIHFAKIQRTIRQPITHARTSTHNRAN